MIKNILLSLLATLTSVNFNGFHQVNKNNLIDYDNSQDYFIYNENIDDSEYSYRSIDYITLNDFKTLINSISTSYTLVVGGFISFYDTETDNIINGAWYPYLDYVDFDVVYGEIEIEYYTEDKNLEYDYINVSDSLGEVGVLCNLFFRAPVYYQPHIFNNKFSLMYLDDDNPHYYILPYTTFEINLETFNISCDFYDTFTGFEYSDIYYEKNKNALYMYSSYYEDGSKNIRLKMTKDGSNLFYSYLSDVAPVYDMPIKALLQEKGIPQFVLTMGGVKALNYFNKYYQLNEGYDPYISGKYYLSGQSFDKSNVVSGSSICYSYTNFYIIDEKYEKTYFNNIRFRAYNYSNSDDYRILLDYVHDDGVDIHILDYRISRTTGEILDNNNSDLSKYNTIYLDKQELDDDLYAIIYCCYSPFESNFDYSGIGGNGVNDIWGLFYSLFHSLTPILNLQIFNGFTLGLIITLPIFAMLLFFIIGLFKR